MGLLVINVQNVPLNLTPLPDNLVHTGPYQIQYKHDESCMSKYISKF